MARREWADKIVKQEMTGYHWNARIRKSTVILPDIAAKLLVKEHERAVRIVKRLQKNAERGGFGLAYGVALKDVLAALQKWRA